jgi:hypothetical protein
MVAKHRKVHLFDIDIKGKQVFKVSLHIITLTPLIYTLPIGVGVPHRWREFDNIRSALWQDWTRYLLRCGRSPVTPSLVPVLN